MNLVSWLAGYLVIGSVIGYPAIGLGHRGIASSHRVIGSGNRVAGTDVVGVVRDARGRPMMDVRVSLMRVDDLPPESPGAKPKKTLVELEATRTPASGAFKFEAVSNGHYQLMLARDMNWMIAEGLVLDGTPRPSIQLTMDGKTRVVSIRTP